MSGCVASGLVDGLDESGREDVLHANVVRRSYYCLCRVMVVDKQYLLELWHSDDGLVVIYNETQSRLLRAYQLGNTSTCGRILVWVDGPLRGLVVREIGTLSFHWSTSAWVIQAGSTGNVSGGVG